MTQLEANYEAIGYFKKALGLHHNTAIVPLMKLLEEQQEILKEGLKDLYNQDALSGQCTNDLKEAKAFAKALEDALTRNKKGALTPIDFSFSPAFFANTALDTAKPKPKSSTTKPL